MSTLKLFSLTQMKSSKNFKIDSIADYLEQFSYDTVENFQYIKQQLKVNIKVDKSQNALSGDAEAYDYAAIQNDNDDIVFYYFINTMNWISRSTIQFELLCDTLNTFNAGSDYSLSSRTKVIREHKDRFYSPYLYQDVFNNAHKLIRKIEFQNEGLNPQLYRTTEPIRAEFDVKWYLVYRNRENLDENEKGAMIGYLVPDVLHEDLNVFAPVIADKEQFTRLSNKYSYIESGSIKAYSNFNAFNPDNPATITLNATTSNRVWIVANANNTVDICRYAGGSATVMMTNVARVIISNCDKVYHQTSFTETLGVQIRFIFANISNPYLKYNNLTSMNLYDPKIVKIISLPYEPYNLGLLDETNTDTPFAYDMSEPEKLIVNPNYTGKWERTIYVDSTNVHNPYTNLYVDNTNLKPSTYRNILFESKMYNSEFYNPKYYYDSFGTSVSLEKQEIGADTFGKDISSPNSKYFGNKVVFYASKNLNSRFMFKLLAASEGNSLEDYPNMFVASRNNEVTLYNSAYINYIKTGYNYDVKAKERNKTATVTNAVIGGVSTLVALGTAIASGGMTTGLVIGSAGTTISSTMSAINSIKAQEEQLQSKLATLSNQAVTVANCDDLDLLEQYCGNALQYSEYSLSSEMRNAIYNLFFFYGYAVNEYKIPNTTSRTRFNFIQMDMEIDINNRIKRDDFIEDLKARYSSGVTIIHKYNNTWDIGQVHENWETALVPYFQN